MVGWSWLQVAEEKGFAYVVAVLVLILIAWFVFRAGDVVGRTVGIGAEVAAAFVERRILKLLRRTRLLLLSRCALLLNIGSILPSFVIVIAILVFVSVPCITISLSLLRLPRPLTLTIDTTLSLAVSSLPLVHRRFSIVCVASHPFLMLARGRFG